MNFKRILNANENMQQHLMMRYRLIIMSAILMTNMLLFMFHIHVSFAYK